MDHHAKRVEMEDVQDMFVTTVLQTPLHVLHLHTPAQEQHHLAATLLSEVQ
jgi:hypothetical protein